MPIKIDVKKGTRTDAHICPECDHCTATTGRTENLDRTYCEITSVFTDRVSTCTAFQRRNSREHNMRVFGGLAWYTHIDRHGDVWFLPPDIMGNPARMSEYLKQRRIRTGHVDMTEDAEDAGANAALSVS